MSKERVDVSIIFRQREIAAANASEISRINNDISRSRKALSDTASLPEEYKRQLNKLGIIK